MNELERIETAIYRNNLAALKKLVTAKNVDSRDEDGFTLAMCVVLADETDPRLLALLIERGADANAVEAGRNYTALHFAASDQRREMVRILLEAGADADALDVDRNTPLCLCVQSSDRDLELVKLLLEHGADPSKKNRDGDSPLRIAKFAEDDELMAVLKHKPAAAAKQAESKRSGKSKKPAKSVQKKSAGRKKASRGPDKSWTKQYQKLRKELVPKRGPAKTLQGELLRLAGKLCWEAFGNGNINWTKEHERAWKFVGQSLRDPEVFSREELAEIKRHVQSVVKGYDTPPVQIDGSPHDELCRRTVEWCLAHPKKIAFKPNTALYSF